ncbi:MAG: CDP-diacylglycerol--glycerol-3-phosphate 3-phosphatidyltransferase [Gemmataceae bacterium]|nr:CDP-diacylglycerol--glycerol-3-phosphate 3-phosphatidyltransferase [Gemmataceae bacterium]
MSTMTPTRPPVFNLPNQLTAGRLGLAVVLFVLIEFKLWLWCMAVFALAAFTDWLDGYLARKLNLGSTLGRNLDPLVDKVLICGAYIFLLPVPNSGLEPWMVVVVVARELIITGLRGFMESVGAVFGADWLGKIKMVLQCAALVGIFWALESPAAWVDVTRDVLVWVMVITTALSGLQYLWRAFDVLRMERVS